jgi:hypothetical protein
MKKYNSIILLILALFAFSCSDDDNNTNTDDAALKLGEITFSIDGNSWKSMNAMAVDDGDGTVSIGGSRLINSNTGTETIGIAISSIQTGQNEAMATFTVMPSINDPMNLEMWIAEIANVNITKSNSDEIEGTFSCTLSNENSERKITNGKFRVGFPN